jgi:peptidyl-prolyl cis-trans isomerase D
MSISWMQKHKKWLIITIWISTIAFVGAGFVGWGSYNYGKSDGAVAVVGDKEVPLVDLQNEYSNLYSQYQNMFGGKFTQEMADQFKLEEAALQRIVQKYLLLNYANELGLITTDEEVAQELVQIEAFQKDGKFDKDTYLQVLQQNRRTAAEFEKQIKQDLLISKVQNIFSFQTLDEEIKNIGELIFSQSKVAIKILEADNIKIEPTKEQLQEYYEKNKENYKSQKGYEVAVVEIENLPNTDQKQMLKVALKKYLDL